MLGHNEEGRNMEIHYFFSLAASLRSTAPIALAMSFIVLYMHLSLWKVKCWYHPSFLFPCALQVKGLQSHRLKGCERNIWCWKAGIHTFTSVGKWRVIVGSDFPWSLCGELIVWTCPFWGLIMSLCQAIKTRVCSITGENESYWPVFCI